MMTTQEHSTNHDDQSNRESILSVRELKKHYPITKGILRRETGRVRAVDGISFDLLRGETLGLVGESGCGKSTVARTVVSLETPTDGQVYFRNRPVTSLSTSERKQYRRQVQIVFQNPASSFDPRMTIGESIAEPMETHGLAESDRRAERINTLLELVGLAPVDQQRYPHELSGGEKQRAALARALSLNPALLVLDEPVSALDVSVQAEILTLIENLQQTFDLSILLISHDISVIQQLCDRVVVMYLGEPVEKGRTNALFDDPKHPYTKALLDAIPQPNPHDRGEMTELTGEVPDPASPPPGCRFHTRCPEVIPPRDWSLSQSTWQGIFSLRIALREDELSLASLREQLAVETEADDIQSVPDSDLQEKIRQEYGIPQNIDHPEAERLLSSTTKKIIDQQTNTAMKQLAEEFPTICEKENPKNRTVNGHSVACHLYNGE